MRITLVYEDERGHNVILMDRKKCPKRGDSIAVENGFVVVTHVDERRDEFWKPLFVHGDYFKRNGPGGGVVF